MPRLAHWFHTKPSDIDQMTLREVEDQRHAADEIERGLSSG